MQLNRAALRAIRERSGMTIASLARAVGISPDHLSNIEAGRRNPSPDIGVALAKALKVELPAILADPDPDDEAVAS